MCKLWCDWTSLAAPAVDVCPLVPFEGNTVLILQLEKRGALTQTCPVRLRENVKYADVEPATLGFFCSPAVSPLFLR